MTATVPSVATLGNYAAVSELRTVMTTGPSAVPPSKTSNGSACCTISKPPTFGVSPLN